MSKKECITLINKTIEQLESFGYQWALERADDLKKVVEYVNNQNQK